MFQPFGYFGCLFRFELAGGGGGRHGTVHNIPSVASLTIELYKDTAVLSLAAFLAPSVKRPPLLFFLCYLSFFSRTPQGKHQGQRVSSWGKADCLCFRVHRPHRSAHHQPPPKLQGPKVNFAARSFFLSLWQEFIWGMMEVGKKRCCLEGLRIPFLNHFCIVYS